MELHLKITGFILILLASIHIIFPKYFNWKGELADLSLVNRQMIYVHTFFIAVVVFLMGLLCISSSATLFETKLGSRLALGLCIFWLIRLFVQFFGYSSKLWKGKRTETLIHIVFSFLWTYMSIVFFMLFWINKDL